MAWVPPSAQKRERPRPVMNVTPLVDVVLVLLIIFMVVIPAMDDSLNIVTPGALNVDEKAEEKVKPFTLSVTAAGEVYLEDEPISLQQLEKDLRDATRREPNRRLVLRGDQNVPYGLMRRIYRSCQEVGFPGVSLRVNRKKDDAAN
jgi:biopolymer transport protein TolR